MMMVMVVIVMIVIMRVTVKTDLCTISDILYVMKAIADNVNTRFPDLIYLGRKHQVIFDGPPFCDCIFNDLPLKPKYF